MEKGHFKATVIQIKLDGKHGPFAVAKVKDSRFNEQESVTFALTEKVWAEPEFPEKGHKVVLGNLTCKTDRKGNELWRAGKARFFELRDRKETSKNNQIKKQQVKSKK